MGKHEPASAIRIGAARIADVPIKSVMELKYETIAVRVNSEDQADSGLGLKAQRQRIRAYCELKDLQPAEILGDPSVSGDKALSIRPSGARPLALTRKSKPVVVVAKFDRQGTGSHHLDSAMAKG
jgi:DNA invertase Pin-like site-specific DNA recombinase